MQTHHPTPGAKRMAWSALVGKGGAPAAILERRQVCLGHVARAGAYGIGREHGTLGPRPGCGNGAVGRMRLCCKDCEHKSGNGGE